jgi:hypothetical protein
MAVLDLLGCLPARRARYRGKVIRRADGLARRVAKQADLHTWMVASETNGGGGNGHPGERVSRVAFDYRWMLLY